MDESWTPGEPVALPLEDTLDLHSFRPEEVLDVVASYLEVALTAGFSQVRLIHGKGKGIQRAQIRAFLQQLSCVRRASDAPKEAGGWGVTVVELDLTTPEKP